MYKVIDILLWFACAVFIVGFMTACLKPIPWYVYEIKCYSKGVVIFDKTLTGRYSHSTSGFTFHDVDGSYYAITGDCVSTRIGEVDR